MAKRAKNPVFAYFQEAKEELQKVTWPSQKETIRYSAIVIVISVAIAAYFGAIDWVLKLGLDALISFTQ